jgi:hypothetical protein
MRCYVCAAFLFSARQRLLFASGTTRRSILYITFLHSRVCGLVLLSVLALRHGNSGPTHVLPPSLSICFCSLGRIARLEVQRVRSMPTAGVDTELSSPFDYYVPVRVLGVAVLVVSPVFHPSFPESSRLTSAPPADHGKSAFRASFRTASAGVLVDNTCLSLLARSLLWKRAGSARWRS